MNIPTYLKNKYVITSILFLSYMFFLDDMDIFSIVGNLRKRANLTEQREIMSQKVADSRNTLKKLRNIEYLEHYARSTKFFKQEDEEIFVIIPKGTPKQ